MTANYKTRKTEFLFLKMHITLTACTFLMAQASMMICDKKWDKEEGLSKSEDRRFAKSVSFQLYENGRSGRIRTHDPFTTSDVPEENGINYSQLKQREEG